MLSRVAAPELSATMIKRRRARYPDKRREISMSGRQIIAKMIKEWSNFSQ